MRSLGLTRWIGLFLTFGFLSSAPLFAQEPKKPDVPKSGRIRWEKKQIIKSLNEGMVIADVNRDGKPDLIAGPNWFEGPDWKPHPLRELKVDNKEFFTSNGDHAFDLNGDGWVDVVSGSWFSDKIYWYENPGKEGLAAGKLWKQHFIVDRQNACEGILLRDIDRDGIPELIVNSWDENKPLTVVRITPGKDGQEPKFEAANIADKGFGHGIALGDINGDKRADIWVARGWYEQPAEKWWTQKWTFHPEFDFPHASVPGIIVDVNGDGKNDLIIGHAHDYGLYWFEQGPAQDGKITWTEHLIDKSFSQVHCLLWAGVDGKGQKEFITGKRYRAHGDGDPGAHDPVCLFRFVWHPTTKQFDRDTISYDDGVSTGMSIRVGDLDGDDKPDIAVAGKSGTYILFNRGPSGSASSR